MRIKANQKKGGNARRLEIEQAKRLILAGAKELPASVNSDSALADWALMQVGHERVLALFGNEGIHAIERRLCARLRKAKHTDNVFGRYHAMALAMMV